MTTLKQWLPTWLAGIADPEHRKLLHTYATWRILRQLRASAAVGPIGHYRQQIARRRLRVAATFLDHLADQNGELAGCTQAQLDLWIAHATAADQTALRPFVKWAVNSGNMERLNLPPTKANVPTPMTQSDRLAWIRQIYDGDSMDLTERVAALLILLYAQPLTKVARLSTGTTTSPWSMDRC